MRQTVAGRTGGGDAALALRDAFAPFAMRPARPGEVGAIHDLGAALIGAGLAPAAAMRAVYRRQRCGFYVAREDGRLTAAMALVLLNAEGFQAVCDDTFDPIRPDPAHVIAAGEAPHAVYGWGLGATTRESARALVASCQAVLEAVPRPFFARAATEAGRRLLVEKLGFRPYPNSDTGLIWRDGGERARRAA